MRRLSAGIAVTLLLFARPIVAAEDQGEHNFVLELGPAAEWPLHAQANYGGNVAVEKEVIEDWLELELGVSYLGSNGRNEMETDFLFKKPFQLSPTVEMMIGVGPSVNRTFHGPERGTSTSVEFAADFMFWPTKDIGWYVEPTWSVVPGTGERAFGATGGLTVGF